MYVRTPILALVCSIDFDKSLKQVIFGEERVNIYTKQLLFKKFAYGFWHIIAKYRENKKSLEIFCLKQLTEIVQNTEYFVGN